MSYGIKGPGLPDPFLVQKQDGGKACNKATNSIQNLQEHGKRQQACDTNLRTSVVVYLSFV